MRGQDPIAPRRLDSRLAAVLAYLLGIVSGIIMLKVEREDRFVRLHAVQSIVFSSVAFVAFASLSMASLAWLSSGVALLAFGIWLYLIVRAWRGDWYQLPIVGPWAERSV
jgi:uncharacterized membrane protein